MKSIATINFKGGVGKTTVTWLLAKYVAERKKKKVLVVDTDAQMSLTLAIQLQETGKMIGDFEKWYDDQHIKNKKTLLSALEQYDTLKADTSIFLLILHSSIKCLIIFISFLRLWNYIG